MSAQLRLSHTSHAAFRRLMQMSSSSVFVLVEGRADRVFYDRICKSLLSQRNTPYDVCSSDEICPQPLGKSGLLLFFKYLSKRTSLVDEFKGKRTVAMFFLDKDVDDILKKSNPSPHIFYTQYYELENHIVAHGDLVDASAAAALLDRQSVLAVLKTDNHSWRRAVAEDWKDWVKLCLYTQHRGLRTECNYSVPSRINLGPYTPVDKTQYATRLARLRAESGLTARGFDRAFMRISKVVDGLCDQEKFDSVFKGKWYLAFLGEDVRRMAAGRHYNPNDLQARLLGCLLLTLDFSASWSEYFTRSLKTVLDRTIAGGASTPPPGQGPRAEAG